MDFKLFFIHIQLDFFKLILQFKLKYQIEQLSGFFHQRCRAGFADDFSGRDQHDFPYPHYLEHRIALSAAQICQIAEIYQK